MGLAPENTLISFQTAIDLGVDGIELDVRLTSDGELIVIHDSTLDRTTNSQGQVSAFSLNEIKKITANQVAIIPTLIEVLDLVNKKCIVNIELKEFETAEKVVDLIEEYVQNKKWHYSDFLVSSFDWHALKKIRYLNSDIQIGVLTETDLEMAFEFAKFLKATTIVSNYLLLDEKNIIEIQNCDIKIIAWTVNEIEAIEKMKTLKIGGIITDFPDRI